MNAITTEAPAAPARFDLVDPGEVAQLFRVSRQTVTRWVRLGQLPKPARVGNAIRWRRQTIEQILAGH